MSYLTLIAMNWALLCLIGGAMDGLGQLLCKNAWRPPPYVIVGTLGIMWFLCPVVLMSMGTTLPFPMMTLGQVTRLGSGVMLLAFAVGFMFWADNLTRFDANNKAPFVGFVLILVEISAALTAFLLQIVSGKIVAIDLFQLLGATLALLSMACFWTKKLADERAQKKEGMVDSRPPYTPFIPLNWVTLSIITGVLAGLGGIFYKEVSDSMPPYVFTGIIGLVWVASSFVFMAGRKLWSNMGLKLKILSFREAAAFGGVVFGSLILAGFLTWAANMGRFGAIHTAPYVGYVYLLFPITAGSLALVLEYWYQRRRYHQGRSNTRPTIGTYGWFGVALATLSLVFFSQSS